MTIRRKTKRRSHIRIRRYSQNPSASHADTAFSAAANVQLIDDSTHSDSTESIERARWEPRVVSTTSVESAISTVVDEQIERDDSGLASEERIDTTLAEANESEASSQGEIAEFRSEQPPQQPVFEEQTSADSESVQAEEPNSEQSIEGEQNEGPVADQADTKSKVSETSWQDPIDFLMQDFMNSQHPLPPPEEVTWDIKIEPRPLPKGSRIAKFATISTLLVSLLGISCFIAYHKLVVPTPVALGMASGNVLLPEPIHLSDRNLDEYSKQQLNKRADPKVSSNSSAAQAQPMKQLGSAEIVPEITSNSTVAAATEKPAVVRDPDKASSNEPTVQSEAKSGDKPGANQPTTPESVATEQQATSAKSTAEQPSQNNADATYRQTVEQAHKLHKRSRRAKAKKEYQRALEINPNGAEALGRLAFYSLEESKYTEAIKLAERATQIDPSNSEGWIVLGAARQATADRKGAMLAYRKCSESTGQYVNECRRLLR